MENLNSTVNESAPVAEAVPATPVESVTPVETAAPAPVAAAPVVVAKPAPKPAVVFTGELPKTDGKTPGGWNRFAGYDPKAAKDKKNDRRDGKGRK